jgi:hypothetical protein
MIKSTIINSVKLKAFEIGKEYFKDKIETTKEDVLRYIEKTIEQKIKKEVKKILYSTVALILAITGIIFLIFGAIAALVHITNLPNFFTPLFFGLILMLGSIIIYINK